VPVGLGDFQTYNPIYGVTNNPWDLARTPGGSTGGGAAALASGLGCLSLGSDLAGSIRIPAHFCGVYGHKPTLQLVSIAGHQPGPWEGSPGLPMDLAVAGPLARSARDLALALNAMGGPNGDEAKAWSWRLPPPRHQRLKDFRIGYVMDSEFAPLASDVRKVYEDTVGQLRKAGAQLETGWPVGIEPREQLETFYYLVSAFLSLNSTNEQREAARARLEKDPNDIFAAGAVEPHSRWLRESQRRLNFR
jgi:amidase